MACQLDAIGTCLSKQDLWDTLSSLPSTLEEMYGNILSKVPQRYQVTVHRILQYLIFSYRPMKAAELVELPGINIESKPYFNQDARLEEASDVFRICSSLVAPRYEPVVVIGSDTYDQFVVIAHLSVKDYLLSDAA